jgi:hypothetical protein
LFPCLEGLGLPTPYPASECAPPPTGPKWGRDTLAGGVGGPNTDDGTETLVLYVYYSIIPLQLRG